MFRSRRETKGNENRLELKSYIISLYEQLSNPRAIEDYLALELREFQGFTAREFNGLGISIGFLKYDQGMPGIHLVMQKRNFSHSIYTYPRETTKGGYLCIHSDVRTCSSANPNETFFLHQLQEDFEIVSATFFARAYQRPVYHEVYCELDDLVRIAYLNDISYQTAADNPRVWYKVYEPPVEDE